MIDTLESQEVESMERQGDLFSPKSQTGADYSLHASDDWKEVVTRYADENQRLKAQIFRITGMLQRIE